ncbi:melanocortin receptor 5-like [Acanthaster planci]|uniref:Melanocortin receptor 5-like n=1 Tax=Acanthaster planci TaxID=133434 RepID=A0A8B7YWV6_ACAPL|nr:melanocortin receptor 5-like [Acanthaster planci]
MGDVNASSTVSDDPSTPAMLAGFIFVTLIGGVTSLIYLWLIATTAMESTLHSVSNYLMASLCVSEIVMGMMISWCSFILMISGTTHPVLDFAIPMCCTFLTLTSYFLNSIAVASDRYLKISRPLQYPRLATARCCVALIGAIWCASCLAGLTMYLTAFSNFNYENYRAPLLVLSNLIVLPSMVVMACLIAALVRIARHQRRRIQDERMIFQHLQDHVQRTQQELHTESARQHHPNHSSDKTTTYFIVHFTTFVAAWLPASVSYDLTVFNDLNVPTQNVVLVATSMVAIVDTFGGTMFLAYVQPEHRQAASNNLKRMKQFFLNR